MYAEIYVTTTVDGAVFDSRSDDLDGGTTVNNTNYLYTDSALADRQVLYSSASNDDTFVYGEDDSDFSALGIDGTWMRGFASFAIRNGTPTGAPTTFHGTEHSCAFFGQVAHSGNA